MATVNMMRCTVPHWQGMDFVNAGAIFPEGDARIIAEFFELVAYDAPAAKRAKRAKVKSEYDPSGETYETETKGELHDEAESRGLAVSGTKDDLMDRLEADDAAALEDEE